MLAALAFACDRPCPSLAPGPTAVADAPASARLDGGAASVEVAVRGAEDRAPRPGVPVVLRCDCLREPLRLATDASGLARAHGLPAGSYDIEVEMVPAVPQRARVVLVDTAKIRLVRELPAPPRRVRGDPSLLPAGVAVRYERTACLGPCPAFVTWLDDEGRVRLEREGEARVWRIGAVARRRSLRLARCLALAPSYGARVRTDFPAVSVAVRDGDGVAVSRHERGDPRAPRALAELEAKLARALGVTRRVGR